MCGICGFSGNYNPDILKQMGNSIIHRGPDEEGYYSDGLMNLCSRRLSIVDLDTGRQPIHNEDKSLWVVLNGEIYNHESLRTELESKGHFFYTDHCDTEVLVHLYEEYGLDFLRKLNGMYAFAMWDTRTRELLLARDRMGVKPLFYYISGDDILFSSEIKAFFYHPVFKKEVNKGAIYQYFSFKNVIAPDTAYTNTYQLPPGHYAVWNGKGICCKKYWSIYYGDTSKDSFEEAKEKIRAILMDAVRIRIPKDVDMGTFLSGGLDSSLITAMTARYSGERLKTFSLCYPRRKSSVYKKDKDEIYAEKISNRFQTTHRKTVLSSDDMIRELPSVVRAFDQPFSGSISTYYLSAEISKYVKVAFSGDGADELFGSYLFHRVAQPFGQYSELRLQGKTEKEAFERTDSNSGEFSQSFLENMFIKSQGRMADMAYALLQIDDNKKKQLLVDGFISSNRDGDSTKDLVEYFFASSSAKDFTNKALEYDWNNLLPNQILAFTDFLSMAHSLEVRNPFLDYRLVEYVASLPGEYKIKRGTTKRILKEVAREFIDDEIVDRSKEGFVQPTYDWLQDELKGYVTDTLDTFRIRKHGILREDTVKDILLQYYSDPKQYVGQSQLIWNLIMFQNWCEMYL